MNAAMPRRLKLFQYVALLLLLVVVVWMCSSYYNCQLRTTSPLAPSIVSPSHPTAAQNPAPVHRPPNQCFQTYFQVISQSSPHSRREKVPLVSVNRTHTLLISAYLDLRDSRREVRIISVALRNEQPAYRCVLCCQGRRRIVPGSAYVHSDHFGFDYGTADIFCLLPDGCPDPSHVAVSAVAPPEEEEDEKKEQQLRFLEVQNRRPINKDFPHNFSVCLSTMFDFSNVLQLIQSMEMLRLMGVTKVMVYKTNCSADTQRVLEYYEHIGFMEVIVWPLSRVLDVSRGWLRSLSQGQLHYYGQIPALCDCLYRNMYQSRYLGLHDMDELIVPQTVDSWTELLPLLEQHHGMDFGYMFENFVLPISGLGAPPTPATTKAWSPKHWQEVEGVNILDHLHYEPLITAEFSKFKILVNPRAVFIPTVHGFLESLRGTIRVPSTVARMYHTREPLTAGLKPKDLTFDGRLLAYRDRLIPAVDAVLEQTGLLHQDLTYGTLGS